MDRFFRFQFLSYLLNYRSLFFWVSMILRLSVLNLFFQLNFVTLLLRGAGEDSLAVNLEPTRRQTWNPPP
jgi:hypothetical protein